MFKVFSHNSSTATPSSLERISERIVEQIVDISSGGGLGQGSASSAGGADEDFTRFFALFTMRKVRSAGQEVSAQLGGHVSSSTLSARQMARAGEPADSVGSDVWVLMRTSDIGKPYYWNRRTEGITVVWVGTRDEEGVLFYWHRDTRVSTYTLPPLPPG